MKRNKIRKALCEALGMEPGKTSLIAVDHETGHHKDIRIDHLVKAYEIVLPDRMKVEWQEDELFTVAAELYKQDRDALVNLAPWISAPPTIQSAYMNRARAMIGALEGYRKYSAHADYMHDMNGEYDGIYEGWEPEMGGTA